MPISWFDLLYELKLMVVSNATDFKSLYGLVSLDVSIAEDIVRLFRTIFPALLRQSFSPAIQDLVLDHLRILELGLVSSQQFLLSSATPYLDNFRAHMAETQLAI